MALFGKKKLQESSETMASRLRSASVTAIASSGRAQPRFAPGTEIGYHPDLIERFQKAHGALQKLYAAVNDQAAKNEFKGAQQSLEAFKKALTGHLLEENVKLYTYLGKCLASEPDNKELITSMRSEMGQIGVQVMAFIKQYSQSGITRLNKKEFLIGWEGIGAILADRIEREETSLYTMYMPPGAYQ